jgi:phosphate-selective porin OprO/OprP
VRSNNDRYWAGIYVTGPTSGTTHAFPEQLGAFGRFSYQVVQTSDTTLHVGVNAEGLMKPATSGGVRSVALSDRPELRLDPTTIINTGQLGSIGHPVASAAVYGLELAGTWRNFYWQGEGFNYSVSRQGVPDNNFWGGYLAGAWTITGERRIYNPGSGAYGGINPEHPFSLSPIGLGAWELAARYSFINLDDNAGSGLQGGAPANAGNGVLGGRQQIMTLGLNWYPNTNIKFLLNYLHGTIDKPSTSGENGASFDAVALRTQIAF